MLDPNYLLRVSEGAEQIAEELHSDIVNRIVERMMIRIGRGDDYLLTALDKWQIETVQQAGVLLEDIQKEIAKATRRQQSEIAEAMEEAGVKALEYDHKLYQDVGLSPEPLTQSPHLIRLMQRNYEATMGEWRNFTRTTAFETQKIFITQMDRAYHLVSTGALSYTEAVKEVLDTIVSEGVYVLYPSGHKDTIETATLRAVRTGISQATGQIQEARMDEMDVDLVITSSHLGARPDHQEWQGKIFSRSGSHEKYPNFKASTGYGTGAGLCGWNCRHSFGPYFEGMDNPYKQFDSKENQEQYEKEQHQRALERHIRDTKREVMGIKTAIDNCQDGDLKEKLESMYQQKAALLEKQNDAYHTYCGNNDLKPLEDRLQIAKWDRKQAAAARGAAKKYENNSQKDRKVDAREAAARDAVRNTGAKVEFNEEFDYSIFIEGYDEKVIKGLSEASRSVAELGSKDHYEHMYLVDLESGDYSYHETNGLFDEVGYDFWEELDKNPKRAYAFVHNHNTDGMFSETDMRTLLSTEQIPVMIAVRNDAVKYIAERSGDVLQETFYDELYPEIIGKLREDLKNGIITSAERTAMRERQIVESLLRDYTKGGCLIEQDGRK